MAQVRLTTQGSAKVMSEFNKVMRNVSDATPAFKEMAVKYGAHQEVWFKTKGGGTWAPLQPKYRRWKNRRFPGRGILYGPNRKATKSRPPHQGGVMKKQATRKYAGKFGIENINPKGLEVGVNTTLFPYAEKHHYGKGRMPERKVFRPIDPSLASEFTTILADHIARGTVTMKTKKGRR